MRLSTFIRQNMEAILVEWEDFARSRDAATADMSVRRLRDHAQLMLETIAIDIEAVQSADDRYEKAQGNAPLAVGHESAASSHGTDRQETGFTLIQLISEFRAVRASVLRLWLPVVHSMDESVFRDMVRFNEAVDQAIAESVATYSDALGKTRDTFLAMLGHDLRGPLHAMGMSGAYLARDGIDDERRITAANRVVRNSALMSGMVNDLLEYARLQMGGLMRIERRDGDLASICATAVDDARAVHPQCQFILDAPERLDGRFDAARLLQALGNLLNNASQYRLKDTAVTLHASKVDDTMRVEVQNYGAEIPSSARETIFEPLVQLDIDEDTVGRPQTSIGLGLFISRKIVEAHRGTIRLESGAPRGNVFRIELPATLAAAA